MSDLIFARSRHHYDSYRDYWRLVELSEFSICYVDEMDVLDRSKTYIISPMNGDYRAHIDSRFPNGRPVGNRGLATLIWWNLERPGGSGSIGQYGAHCLDLKEAGYVDRALISDLALARIVGAAQFVPLGSHPDLGRPGQADEKQFDFTHLMCYSNYRSPYFHSPAEPRREIEGMTIGPNGWGEARARTLRQTRLMLNVHQDGFPFIEPLRYALAAAYGLPIVTDTVTDAWPYLYGNHYRDALATSLVDAMRQGLADYEAGRWSGQAIWQRMTSEYTFRRVLEMYL